MTADFRLGPWRVEPGLNRISCNGSSLGLEPKVMEVLVCLAHHAGDTLSKEQLLSAVWADTFVSDDVLTRSVSELRRVLQDDPKEPRYIQKIPKRGYRMVAPVEVVNDGSTSTNGSVFWLSRCCSISGHAFVTSGYRATQREVAPQMELYDHKGEFDRRVQIAIAYSRLEDKDQAKRWLERAYKEHEEEFPHSFTQNPNSTSCAPTPASKI